METTFDESPFDFGVDILLSQIPVEETQTSIIQSRTSSMKIKQKKLCTITPHIQTG